ncbi:MAG: hypothetical protein AAGF87_01685 [Bacteroidota bacterium]
MSLIPSLNIHSLIHCTYIGCSFIVAVLFVSFIFFGCAKDTKKQKFWIPIDKLALTTNPKDGTSLEIIDDTTRILRYREDTVEVVELYRYELTENGLRERRCYYPGSLLMMVENFNSQGIKDGTTTTFYKKEGCINVQGHYKDGVEDGQWFFNYPNCMRQLSVGYVDGVHTGRDTFFRADGTLDLIMKFVKDIPVDTGLSYNESGELEHLLIFEDGAVTDSIDVNSNASAN